MPTQIVRTRMQAGKNSRKASRRVRDNGGRVATCLRERKAIIRLYQTCPLGYEVDHIVPVSRGGSHTLDNLQLLTREENVRKGNK